MAGLTERLRSGAAVRGMGSSFGQVRLRPGDPASPTPDTTP